MTHLEFFKACTAAKKIKESLVDRRPTDTEAATLLSEMCKFVVCPSAIKRIKEATGVNWRVKRSDAVDDSEHILVIACTLNDLLNDLGKPLPPRFARVLAELHAIPAPAEQ